MSIPPLSAEELQRLLTEPSESEELRERLRWLLHYVESGSVSDTCRRFGIARTTFYRWARRFDPRDLSGLRDLPTHPSTPEAPTERVITSTAIAEPLSIPAVSVDCAPSVSAVPVSSPSSVVASPSVSSGREHLRPIHRSPLKRALLVGSVLANLALLGFFLSTVVFESHHATIRANASLIDDASLPSP